MSFIKRSDGTTVDGGTHSVPRTIGEAKVQDDFEEDDIDIESSLMSFEESVYLSGDCEEEGLELAECLWGVYGGECNHLNRGGYGDLFRPAGR